ncbi:MAG TPA: MATE family efflux transporter [Dehalococcoidales bacterium]|nr:MATE family efflux transporter [Dehalococcoidales bacterium]
MVKEEKPPRQEAAFRRDWTQGSVIRNLLLLSWPMVLMETLFVVSQVADMIWVGKLGPSSIAGVGVANIVISLVMSMDIGLIVGVRAMVARFVGAGNVAQANHVAAQGFIVGAAWGLLMTAIGVSLAGPIMNLFGMENVVVSEGTAYMRWMFAGWLAMDILVMGLYIVQSSGDTVTPLLIEVLIRTIHVTLCPFLVLGLWIFPQMGVRGAAFSNIFSQSLGTLLVLGLLFGGRTRLHLTLKDFRLDPQIIWRILKIGIPAQVMSLQRAFGNFMLIWFMAPFGTLAVAGHSLVTRVEMFLYLPGLGFGMGAGVLLGQNLGAGRPERAEKNGWLALGYLEAIMVACSAAILLWAENIMGIFTSDPALLEISSIFLRIAAAAFLVLAFVSVFQQCIAGAGDTVPNMIISIAMVWVVLLPLAYGLSQYTDLGVYGVRWAIVASTLAGAIAYTVYFKMGRWKVKKV